MICVSGNLCRAQLQADALTICHPGRWFAKIFWRKPPLGAGINAWMTGNYGTIATTNLQHPRSLLQQQPPARKRNPLLPPPLAPIPPVPLIAICRRREAVPIATSQQLFMGLMTVRKYGPCGDSETIFLPKTLQDALLSWFITQPAPPS